MLSSYPVSMNPVLQTEAMHFRVARAESTDSQPFIRHCALAKESCQEHGCQACQGPPVTLLLTA